MIGASRRKSAVGRRELGPAFELHRREARTAALHRRLLHASLAALVCALIALFLPIELASRAWLALGAAVLGGAWPLRSGVSAALASIRSQTGLSYDTALGLLEEQQEPLGAGAAADPYGLKSAVVERARLSIRGYTSAPRPAWWLPALVVTALLVVVPEFVGTTANRTTNAASPTPAVGSEPVPEAERAADPEAPEPPDPGRVEAPGAVADQEEGDGEAPVTDLPEGDLEGQAPLARYLQSLRERPADAGAPVDGSQSEGDVAGPEQRASDAEREAGDGQRSGDGERSQSDTGGDSSEGGESADASETPGSSELAQQEEDGAGESAAEAGSEDGDQDMQAGGDQLDQGQSAEGGQEQGNDSLQASTGGDPGSDAEGAESAGTGGSEGLEEALEAQGAGGQMEQLQGVLQSGPENVAGSVRLPGSNEVELPPGTSYAPYQNAAEEALTEGDLPLDYQEIIRRYFQ